MPFSYESGRTPFAIKKVGKVVASLLSVVKRIPPVKKRCSVRKLKPGTPWGLLRGGRTALKYTDLQSLKIAGKRYEIRVCAGVIQLLGVLLVFTLRQPGVTVPPQQKHTPIYQGVSKSHYQALKTKTTTGLMPAQPTRGQKYAQIP